MIFWQFNINIFPFPFIFSVDFFIQDYAIQILRDWITAAGDDGPVTEATGATATAALAALTGPSASASAPAALAALGVDTIGDCVVLGSLAAFLPILNLNCLNCGYGYGTLEASENNCVAAE
jgi:hypothetical protein